MLRFSWDFFVILSAIVWIFTLVLQGYISIEFAGLILIAIVFFRVLGRGIGGSIGRLVRFLFSVGIPLATLGTFIVVFSGGNLDSVLTILGGIISLFLILLGIYLMFFALFPSKRR